MKTQTCEFVSLSDLIPARLRKRIDILCKIFDDAPFSWGDNNRTLVTASRFLTCCEESLDEPLTQEEKRLLSRLRKLGEMYIDLET